MKHRPAIARIKKIAALLSDGKHVSGAKLAAELEVSPRTVTRDLDFMRDQLELPIETDGCANHSLRGRHGYYFTQPVQLCACCSAKV